MAAVPRPTCVSRYWLEVYNCFQLRVSASGPGMCYLIITPSPQRETREPFNSFSPEPPTDEDRMPSADVCLGLEVE